MRTTSMAVCLKCGFVVTTEEIEEGAVVAFQLGRSRAYLHRRRSEQNGGKPYEKDCLGWTERARRGMSPEQGVPIVPIERGSSLYGEVMADLAMAQRVLGQASSNYART